MERNEEMRLVKDGNAFYEVDEACLRAGLNKRENEGKGKKTRQEPSDGNSCRKKR